MSLASDKAAQCWCDPRVSDRDMDADLCNVVAEQFALILNEPWLGLATTRQLFEELEARFEIAGDLVLQLKVSMLQHNCSEETLNYKTVGEEDESTQS